MNNYLAQRSCKNHNICKTTQCEYFGQKVTNRTSPNSLSTIQVLRARVLLNTTDSEMPLTEKDLPNLMDDLIQVASKWMDLGIKLEMKRSTLLIVEKDHPNDQVRCLSDMLHRLIRKRKVEWRNITEALRSDTLDEGVLATDLEEKYHSGANPLQQDKLKTEETSDQELAPPTPKKFKADHGSTEDPVYPMQCESNHGRALIINNVKFKGKSDRHGSDKDKDTLMHTLRQLHYDVEVAENLSQADMMSKMIEHAQSIDDCDSYICCILSHGKEGEISGSDNQYVKIRDLAKELTKLSHLRGKPKIFFIQACQGSKKPGALPDDPEHEQEEFEEDGEGLTLPRDSDFFYGYSTTPDTVSLRAPQDGSWYIQELCQVLGKHHSKEDLVTMVTRVHHEVATKVGYLYGKYRQQPQLVSTLRGPVYFK